MHVGKDFVLLRVDRVLRAQQMVPVDHYFVLLKTNLCYLN